MSGALVARKPASDPSFTANSTNGSFSTQIPAGEFLSTEFTIDNDWITSLFPLFPLSPLSPLSENPFTMTTEDNWLRQNYTIHLKAEAKNQFSGLTDAKDWTDDLILEFRELVADLIESKKILQPDDLWELADAANHDQMRWELLLCLNKIGERAIQQYVRTKSVTLLESKVAGDRLTAVTCIGFSQDVQSRGILQALLKKEKNPVVTSMIKAYLAAGNTHAAISKAA